MANVKQILRCKRAIEAAIRREARKGATPECIAYALQEIVDPHSIVPRKI